MVSGARGNILLVLLLSLAVVFYTGAHIGSQSNLNNKELANETELLRVSLQNSSASLSQGMMDSSHRGTNSSYVVYFVYSTTAYYLDLFTEATLTGVKYGYENPIPSEAHNSYVKKLIGIQVLALLLLLGSVGPLIIYGTYIGISKLHGRLKK